MTTQQHKELLQTDFIGDAFIEQLKEAYNNIGLLAHDFHQSAGIPGSAFTIKYLSDNGNKADDLAIAEIESRFNDHGDQIAALSRRSAPKIQYNNTPYQDSIGGAYDLAQIARDSSRGIGNIVFLNCAPRKKQRGNGDENLGEQVFVGMLEDGTIIGATGEESFAFFHDLIERGELELYQANVQIKGSQFRSRDYWPLYTLALLDQARDLAERGQWQAGLSLEERRSFLEQLNLVDTTTTADIRFIPKPSDMPAVVRYDVHENLKLNVRASDFSKDLLYDEDGKPKTVRLKIHDKSIDIKLGVSMFDEGGDKFSFSEGSTGHWKDYKRRAISDGFKNVATHDGMKWKIDDKGFLQIALINGSAKNHFGVTDEQLRSEEGVRFEIVEIPAEEKIHVPSAAITSEANGQQITPV